MLKEPLNNYFEFLLVDDVIDGIFLIREWLIIEHNY